VSHIRTTFAEAALPASTGRLPRPQALEGGSRWHGTLARWLGRIRERDQMRMLTERDLRDAGLTAYDVAMEVRKFPWQE
jgi:uncharacterized protein YjiS (DUF1127 family)